jgi:hypothetical protein
LRLEDNPSCISGGSTKNYKVARISDEEPWADTKNSLGLNYDGAYTPWCMSTPRFTVQAFGGATVSRCYEFSDTSPKDGWVRLTMIAKLVTVPNSNGFSYFFHNDMLAGYSGTASDCSSPASVTSTDPYADLTSVPDYVTLGGFWRGCGDVPTCTNEELRHYWDDIYVDWSLARVILSEASTYDEMFDGDTLSENWEPQIPSAWSNTSITFKTNLGKLPNGQAYLYVCDSNNNCNQNGYPIQLGGVPSSHEADTNSNGCIDQTELTNYIPRWYAGTATMQKLMSAIALWIDNIGC